MSTFAENTWFYIEHCCNCGMAFAMTTAFQKRMHDKPGSTFYCPAGHAQHYTGKSEAQKLKDELEHKQRQLDHERQRVSESQQRLATVTKAHHKMRVRVMNGVCPCCNRSFSNLREHMKTQHADFGSTKTLHALRQAFGMTQIAVAEEAGVPPAYVSNYERGQSVPSRATTRLEAWVQRHEPIGESGA